MCLTWVVGRPLLAVHLLFWPIDNSGKCFFSRLPCCFPARVLRADVERLSAALAATQQALTASDARCAALDADVSVLSRKAASLEAALVEAARLRDQVQQLQASEATASATAAAAVAAAQRVPSKHLGRVLSR